ncbi:MAG: hypothetical protein PHP85_04645 [Gallionella sp.]|nr:hypothetical protein [Gallionella sp.]
MSAKPVFIRISRLFSLSLVLLACCSSAKAVEVVRADFQAILNAPGGEFGIWSYADNPSVYVFDFPSLNQQGRTFNRAMQFTEQFNEAYRRVFRLDELNRYLEAIRRNQANFAFGHDFLVSELVLFFNLASKDKIELLPEELVVRDFLVSQGLMDMWRGFYRAKNPDVVILSIPQVQERHDNEPRITELARRAIFTHEISHAEFYANPYYADYCRKFWAEKLSEAQRGVFQKFLSNYNYSLNQQDLLINEMQAYLMFTPDPNSVSATKLGIEDAELEAMRSLFRQGRPPTKLPM